MATFKTASKNGYLNGGVALLTLFGPLPGQPPSPNHPITKSLNQPLTQSEILEEFHPDNYPDGHIFVGNPLTNCKLAWGNTNTLNGFPVDLGKFSSTLSQLEKKW